MMGLPRVARRLGCLAIVVSLAACSNGRGSLDDQASPPPQSPPPPSAPAQTSLTIGGTITGLTGSGLVLQNNGSGDLPVATDGSFTFAATAATGASYNVTVLTQPTSPAQTCTVANGSGALASTNVTNVAVTCSAEPRFFVGGTVAGLTGSGLVLQNNNVDDLTISANGAFKFPAALATNANYSVTVRTQPSGQNCVVKNGAGVIATADVGDIEVSCAANQFTLGGTVSGLRGAGLVLINGTDSVKVVNDGPFAFPTALMNGTAYEVKVADGAQPSNPTQECTLANASGTMANANITSIAVTCVTRRFTVGGTVTGLAGSGLVLRLNGGQDLTIPANGAFTFATPLLSGTSYTVTVPSTPTLPLQQCTASMANGTVRGNNITDVQVTCATQTFAVGGTVTGLLGSGLTLLNNRGDRITVTGNSFVFPTKLASGSTYEVQVGTSPSNPTQACSVANGTGTVTNADRQDVAITCSTSNFTIGGTVDNLSGTLILRNNGGDDLTLTSSGPFTFATAVPSGTNYAVSVAQQPLGFTCNVTGFGTGPVTSANITNVTVQCVKTAFTVGGRVIGLLGPTLVLQNNGGDNLEIAADGPFTFPTPLAVNTPYGVTVFSNPTFPPQACSVVNGNGVIAGSDVQHVDVFCFATGF